MLRNLLIDLNTMNEDRFFELLREFYGRYRLRQATTQDFQRVVEKHVGAPMDWFFDQWVRGTEIPTYRCAHRVERTPDGQYRLSVRIRQEDVPHSFKMYLPFMVDLGHTGQVRLRALIEGPTTEFTLPPLPAKPVGVTFNYLESVLARVKTEGW